MTAVSCKCKHLGAGKHLVMLKVYVCTLMSAEWFLIVWVCESLLALEDLLVMQLSLRF